MIRRILNNLLFKILVAICAGMAAALFLPEWCVRIFETFNSIFSGLLGFIIPLIILGFVAPAIADVGNKAGKMLLATVAVAYISTLGAGFLSYFISSECFPSLVSGTMASAVGMDTPDVQPYFTIQMPPVMPVMTSLILAFILGVGSAAVKGKTIKNMLDEFRLIVSLVINKVIIPLLPLYIFGIFLNMAFTGKVATILVAFAKIILVIFAMHVGILLIQFVIASFFSRGSRNPIKLLLTMMPAYFTALGTQSSAATIPVTLRRTVKMGVDENVAGFTVPLCATIHMSGSVLKIVACAVALMLMRDMPFNLSMFAGFIFMLGVTIVAAPGIPGGSIMASLGVLTSVLGFTDADCALMIALYIAMDSFGTACNVTGDGAIAIIINRIFPKSAVQSAD